MNGLDRIRLAKNDFVKNGKIEPTGEGEKRKGVVALSSANAIGNEWIWVEEMGR